MSDDLIAEAGITTPMDGPTREFIFTTLEQAKELHDIQEKDLSCVPGACNLNKPVVLTAHAQATLLRMEARRYAKETGPNKSLASWNLHDLMVWMWSNKLVHAFIVAALLAMTNYLSRNNPAPVAAELATKTETVATTLAAKTEAQGNAREQRIVAAVNQVAVKAIREALAADKAGPP